MDKSVNIIKKEGTANEQVFWMKITDLNKSGMQANRTLAKNINA